ncbi:MAG: hypothetical protein AB8B63_21200 [Granulosicoccus sp.]
MFRFVTAVLLSYKVESGQDMPSKELKALVATLSERVARYLERVGGA